jgi:transcriptional regulator PpsR
MRPTIGSHYVTQFETPNQSLSGLSAAANAALLSAAADVVLVVDAEGVVQDVSSSAGALPVEGGQRNWIGKSWQDIVTIETRPKIAKLLKDADSDGRTVWRQVNVKANSGPDVPLSFCAIRVGPNGRMIALGRDLRAQSILQQQLVDAQQAMERDYLRLRHLESRYRILFDLTSEGVMVVEGKTLKIVEANPAAAAVLAESVRRLVGRNILDCFDAKAGTALAKLLDIVRASGKADQLSVAIPTGQLTLGVSVIQEESGELLLVRVVNQSQASPPIGSSAAQSEMVLRVLEQTPDAFVVTDNDGEILAANRAFTELVQLSRSDQVVGQSLDRWLGRAGVDLNVLLANLRQRGSVKLFATNLRNENGASIQVEISAVSVPHGELSGLGFTIRDIGRRLGSESQHEIPRSVEQLSELVGRVPMREIVGETTELIEKLCIEAALQLTQDNRATAAEILGLSRQSLYVKLRQYKIGNLGGDK